MPGWRRAPCFGCGERVVAARDGWVTLAGTPDGSYLTTWGTEPNVAYSTDPERAPRELVLFGVAHQQCTPVARRRIADGTAQLPDSLPPLRSEYGDEVPEIPYVLQLPAEPAACPFCGSDKDLTGEDVWPKWYSRFLRERGYSVKGPGTTRGGLAILVPVCATCNNRWMSVLENDVARLLATMMDTAQTSQMTLSVHDQNVLASWAMKTAYLIDAATAPVIPRGFLHRFALRRRPDESTFIWLSVCAPHVAVRASKRAVDFLTPTGPTKNSPNGIVITFSVFSVVFQIVTGFNGPARLDDGRSQYRDALLPIWPTPRSPVVWPPLFGFGRESFDHLATSVGPPEARTKHPVRGPR